MAGRDDHWIDVDRLQAFERLEPETRDCYEAKFRIEAAIAMYSASRCETTLDCLATLTQVVSEWQLQRSAALPRLQALDTCEPFPPEHPPASSQR